MQKTMLAVVKPEAAPGAEIREVKVPAFGRNEVLVKVKVASICGTDLHIYEWDRWAQNRIHPPLIPGHEFCGEVAAFGDEVTSVKEGDFVSAEMHVACGKCLQCRTGEAHICQSVKIIGVDADGAFAEYVVIPESNIWKLDPAIPQEYASILDPLGNAVHSVLAGEIAAKTVAITGCGPIGLFSIAVARAVGATTIFAIEVNEHRRRLAQEMKADFALDPSKDNVRAIVMEQTGGLGADVVLEMAGHPSAIRTAFDVVRRGGRISLLGLTSKPISLNFSEDIIFKGITVQGISGRRMYQTWYQMTALLKAGKLDLHPVITDRIAMKDFSKAMERLKTGEASKILVYPDGNEVIQLFSCVSSRFSVKSIHRIQFQNHASLLHCGGISWRGAGRLSFGIACRAESGPGLSGPRTVAPAAGLWPRRTDEDRDRQSPYSVGSASRGNHRIADRDPARK